MSRSTDVAYSRDAGFHDHPVPSWARLVAAVACASLLLFGALAIYTYRADRRLDSETARRLAAQAQSAADAAYADCLTRVENSRASLLNFDRFLASVTPETDPLVVEVLTITRDTVARNAAIVCVRAPGPT